MRLSEFYLLKLAEECSEVTQRVSKSMQFGRDEIQDGQALTNAQRLQGEVNDVLAMINILYMMPDAATLEAITIKKQTKLDKYLALSRKCGCIDD